MGKKVSLSFFLSLRILALLPMWQSHLFGLRILNYALINEFLKDGSYHRDSPNTRNGARLRCLSPIMAPAGVYWFEMLCFLS